MQTNHLQSLVALNTFYVPFVDHLIILLTRTKRSRVNQNRSIDQHTTGNRHATRSRCDHAGVGKDERQGKTGEDECAGEESTKVDVGAGRVGVDE